MSGNERRRAFHDLHKAVCYQTRKLFRKRQRRYIPAVQNEMLNLNTVSAHKIHGDEAAHGHAKACKKLSFMLLSQEGADLLCLISDGDKYSAAAIFVVLSSLFQFFNRVLFLSHFTNSVQIHAARDDPAGKITNSFSSWLLRLYPYFFSG